MAPRANNLVPAASAIIVDQAGRILLHHRSDSGLWALPGGTMEKGESIVQTVIREVREETGLDVALGRVVGIYTDPRHVIAFDDGEVRQQFSVCFVCHPAGGQLRVSDESTELRYVAIDDLNDLSIHASIRLRIQHYLRNRPEAFVT